MDAISYAIEYWSKGQIQAVFLRHEGFLGAIGAFMGYQNHDVDELSIGDKEVRAIFCEALTPAGGELTTKENENSIFPYLLVDIGSGVCMIEVMGKGNFKHILGTHLGGGTILCLAKHLTGCTSFFEFLEMSQRGNNSSVDVTAGDIFGELVSEKIGVPVNVVASSFGKVKSNELSYYKAEDLAAALLNAFIFNIGQICLLAANLSGLKMIVFRGTYICDHAMMMEKISHTIEDWSKGRVNTTFLRHEGFLDALGTFQSNEDIGINDLAACNFLKQSLLDAPYIRGKNQTSPLEKVLK